MYKKVIKNALAIIDRLIEDGVINVKEMGTLRRAILDPERPQGEWKETDIPKSTLCKCSICNFDLGAYSFNFCPNCGADMRGENNGK